MWHRYPGLWQQWHRIAKKTNGRKVMIDSLYSSRSDYFSEFFLQFSQFPNCNQLLWLFTLITSNLQVNRTWIKIDWWEGWSGSVSWQSGLEMLSLVRSSGWLESSVEQVEFFVDISFHITSQHWVMLILISKLSTFFFQRVWISVCMYCWRQF